jgi:hypothetical protein
MNGPIGMMKDFELKSSRPREWTDAELRKLLAMIGRRCGAGESVAALGRNTGSVKRVARDLRFALKK